MFTFKSSRLTSDSRLAKRGTRHSNTLKKWLCAVAITKSP
jgi:hypothetical protein